MSGRVCIVNGGRANDRIPAIRLAGAPNPKSKTQLMLVAIVVVPR